NDIVVSELDSDETVTVTLTLSDADAGSLSTATSNAVTSTFVGGVWTADGLVDDVNTLLAGVTFTPTADYDQNFTIATSVTDGEATAVTSTKSVSVTAVNDAPTATNMSGAESFTEDDGAFSLTDIVVSEVDSDETVTVTLTLSDSNAGTLSTATSNAVTSTFVAGVWTADGLVADVNTLLASVTFTATADYDLDFTIATSLTDGGSAAVTGTKSVTVTAVNDAPTATNMSAGETFSEDDAAFSLTDIVVSEVDTAETVTVTLTLSDSDAGTLSTATSNAVTSTFVAGVWTADGLVADVNTLLAGVTFTPTADYEDDFTIATSVTDGEAAAVTGTKIVSVSKVNDAPTAVNMSGAESFNEDDGAFSLTDIVVTDVDADDTVTVTLTLSDADAGTLSTATANAVTSTFVAGVWTADGLVDDINTLLAGVTFTPAADYDQNFTIATSVTDGDTPAVTSTKSVTVTPVNDAPTATNMSVAESFTEDDAVFSLTDIVVSDVDTGETVVVTLSLSDSDAGTLSTATANAVTSTFVDGVWTADGLVQDVNTLLAGVTFTPAADYDQDFTIATNVTDGEATAVTGSKVVSVTAVNDAPTASNLNAAESFTEDDGSFNLTAITIADVDSVDEMVVTLTLSDADAGTIATDTSNAVTSTFEDGVWQAEGLMADINTLLGKLIFTPAYNYDQDFTIATSVADGEAATITGTKSVTVTAVNDAPTATNLSADDSYTEDDAAFSFTEIVISDVDSDETVVFTVTLSDVEAGSLATSTSNAVTSTFENGVWRAEGLVDDVNTLLTRMRFTPTPDYDQDFYISTSLTDGEADEITGIKSITATQLNDAPTVTDFNWGERFTEDGDAFNLMAITVTDKDTGEKITATLTLSDADAGTLSTATSNLVSSSFANGVWSAYGLVDDVNTLLAEITFTPAADYDLNFTIATYIADGEADPLRGTKIVTVTVVNDAPTATGLDAEEIFSNSGDAFNLTDIVVTDVDSDETVVVTLTLSDIEAGTLTTATSNAVTSTFENGVWRVEGGLDDVNALLAQVTFTRSDDYDLDFSLATLVTDGYQAVSGSKSFAFSFIAEQSQNISITPDDIMLSEQNRSQDNVVLQKPATMEQRENQPDTVIEAKLEAEPKAEPTQIVETEATALAEAIARGDLPNNLISVSGFTPEASHIFEFNYIHPLTDFNVVRTEMIEESSRLTDTYFIPINHGVSANGGQSGDITLTLPQLVSNSLDNISSGVEGLLWLSDIDDNLSETLLGATILNSGVDDSQAKQIIGDDEEKAVATHYGVIQNGAQSDGNVGLTGMLQGDADGSYGFFAKSSTLQNIAKESQL
ncbi:MAG: hypothetical protein HQL68_07690, partial [Magnetococcales bacterium]|nr:hypothetical protein [Magnetococcales bacterium]